MQFERCTVACCQNGSHPLTAATVLFRQGEAAHRISKDFPRPLTGEREINQSHESGNVFSRIADKKADLMGEGAVILNATAQLRDQ